MKEHIGDILWLYFGTIKSNTRTIHHFLVSNNAAYFKNIKMLNSPYGLKTSFI